MNAPISKTKSREIFFDNLRYVLVLFVILEHSSNAYINLIWWPVADRDTSIIAGWVSAFSDAVAMPLLFYIAGYFAIPTIQNKSIAAFLKGKLRRLGVPWLVCILTICPILPLIYHYTRNDFTLSVSYWDLWAGLMKNAAALNVGLIVSMNELMMRDQFYQRYMWFLSLLLLFFFIFGIIYLLKKNWLDRIEQSVPSEKQPVLSTLKLLGGVGLITAVSSFAIMGALLVLGPKSSMPEPLFTLGNIIQFRPSRLFFFVVYFGLGLMTYRNRWIERGKFPGHFQTWTIAFIVLLIIYLSVHFLMLNSAKHMRNIYGPVFFFILNFLTIATLGFFSSLAIRYWNAPSTFNQNLAANSYNMYLAHYIFVLLFQLMLLTVPGIPGLIKFCIVSLSSVICAYIVSRYLIKPFPKLSIALLLAGLVVMFMVIQP